MGQLAIELQRKKERLERLAAIAGRDWTEAENRAFLEESEEYLRLCHEVRADKKRKAADLERRFLAGPLGFVVAAFGVLITEILSVVAWWSWTTDGRGMSALRWCYLLMAGWFLLETARFVVKRLRAKSERLGLKGPDSRTLEED